MQLAGMRRVGGLRPRGGRGPGASPERGRRGRGEAGRCGRVRAPDSRAPHDASGRKPDPGRTGCRVAPSVRALALPQGRGRRGPHAPSARSPDSGSAADRPAGRHGHRCGRRRQPGPAAPASPARPPRLARPERRSAGQRRVGDRDRLHLRDGGALSARTAARRTDATRTTPTRGVGRRPGQPAKRATTSRSPAARASTSSVVEKTEKLARVVAATSSRSWSGIVQWCPARTQIPNRSRTWATS